MKIIDLKVVKDVLSKDARVLFSYLYGSYGSSEEYNDLDIAVYAKEGNDPFQISSDLKVSLHERTGMPPDFYDIRVINNILEKGDLFSLIYLKRVLEKNQILVDKAYDVRTDFQRVRRPPGSAIIMNIDKAKINRFLMEINKTSTDLNELVRDHNLQPDSVGPPPHKFRSHVCRQTLHKGFVL
jgi:hypothetical protein